MPVQDVNALSALLANFATKLKDLEERSESSKERILLLNRTFLSENKRTNSELTTMKETLLQIKQDTEQIKNSLRHIVKESEGFARKEEIMILQKQIKLFQPLRSVNEDDVKKIVRRELRNR